MKKILFLILLTGFATVASAKNCKPFLLSVGVTPDASKVVKSTLYATVVEKQCVDILDDSSSTANLTISSFILPSGSDTKYNLKLKISSEDTSLKQAIINLAIQGISTQFTTFFNTNIANKLELAMSAREENNEEKMNQLVSEAKQELKDYLLSNK